MTAVGEATILPPVTPDFGHVCRSAGYQIDYACSPNHTSLVESAAKVYFVRFSSQLRYWASIVLKARELSPEDLLLNAAHPNLHLC
ncbi:hypothetical protein GJV44_00365 [Candidatus Vallotia cooleyia]|nr:hypothetical protein GJV44_00365 [Candidatus Vallotia cooleyia]